MEEFKSQQPIKDIPKSVLIKGEKGRLTSQPIMRKKNGNQRIWTINSAEMRSVEVRQNLHEPFKDCWSVWIPWFHSKWSGDSKHKFYGLPHPCHQRGHPCSSLVKSPWKQARDGWPWRKDGKSRKLQIQSHFACNLFWNQNVPVVTFHPSEWYPKLS